MRTTMVGRLDECYLLAYRTDPASVADLLPPGIELFTRDGFAYWNIVVSHVDKMRPAGAPRFVGVSYIHIGYRLYVTARTKEGTLEGLYFVRSDVDDRLMSLVGDAMTDFRFHHADVRWRTDDRVLTVDVTRTKDGKGDAHLRLDTGSAAGTPRPPTFLKYMPLGLSSNARGTKAKLAEVFRDESAWEEDPIRVVDAQWGLFARLGQSSARLVAATRVAPLDYRWRMGRTAGFV